MKQFYSLFHWLFKNKKDQRILLLTSILLLPYALMGQVTVTNKGASITIRNDSLYIVGNFKNEVDPEGFTSEYNIRNSGSFFLSDSLVNNVANPLFSGTTGRVIFNGSREQVILGIQPLEISRLWIRKPGNNLVLQQSIIVLDSLLLLNGNLFLGDSRLELGATNDETDTVRIFEESNSRRIYTGPTGKGTIRTWVKLETSDNMHDPGNMGLKFKASSHPFGITEIIRGNGRQMGAGDGGIGRYYEVIPKRAGMVDTLAFQYWESEKAGLDETKFGLWFSNDRGIIWKTEGGTADTEKNFIRNGEFSFGPNSRLTVGPRECLVNPVVDFGAAILYLCRDETMELDAGNPGMFFKWSTDELSQKITVNKAGKYTVSVTNAQGCIGIGSVEVILKENPIAGFKSSFACLGTETVFTDSSMVNEEKVSYFWNFGTSRAADTANVQNPVFLYDAPGTYRVTLGLTTEYGCVSSVTQDVVVSPLPKASFGIGNVCLDNNIEIINTSIGAAEGARYHWDFGDGTTSTAFNPSKVYSQAGDYAVKLLVESNRGCKDSVTQKISVYPKPVPEFSFTNESICKGDNVAFANNSTSENGKLNYHWDFGDGNTSTLAKPSLVYKEAGVYTITLTASTSYGCQEKISKNIRINACPGPEPVDCNKLNFQVDLGADRELCPGTSINLDAGAEAVSYRWSDNSTGRTLRVERPGTYWVEVMNEYGCVDKDYVTINTLSLDLEEEILFCQGRGITLDAGNPGSSYNWNSDQGVSGFESTLQITKPGKYWVKVERGGCSIADTVRILETSNAMTANFLSASLVDVGDTIEFVQVSSPQPNEFYWNFSDGVVSEEADPTHIYYMPGDYEVMLISGNGVCVDTLNKTITVRALRKEESAPIPVALFTEIMKVKAYPNPTEGTVKLEILLNKVADVDISIYSMSGVIMKTLSLKGQEILESFDFSNYGRGMYIVKIITGNQVKIAKVVKL